MNAVQTIAVSLIAGAIQAAVLDFAMKHKDGIKKFLHSLADKTTNSDNTKMFM